MKKAVYISFIINLLVCIPLHSKDRISEHLYTLQHLINANLAYDSIAPIDSIIIWEQQLSPILEQENQTELFFRIKQLLVHVHSYMATSDKLSMKHDLCMKKPKP